MDDDNIIDAEVVDDLPVATPDCVHCTHPYADHRRHPAPADVAVYMPCTICPCTGYADSDPFADDDIIDAEVVEDDDNRGQSNAWLAAKDRYSDGQQATDRPVFVDQVVSARVTMRPTGREAWFRLYSTPTSILRDHQDHGVRNVWVHATNPHLLTLDLDTGGPFDITALDYRINRASDEDTPQLAIGRGRGDLALTGPDSIDLLVEYPPTLPGKVRYWQQMTNVGQLRHPGNERWAWSYADWFNQDQSTGVRWETDNPSHGRPKRGSFVGLTDDDMPEGFKTLGRLGGTIE